MPRPSRFTLRNVIAHLRSGYVIGECYNLAHSPRIAPTLPARAFLAIAARLSSSTHIINP